MTDNKTRRKTCQRHHARSGVCGAPTVEDSPYCRAHLDEWREKYASISTHVPPHMRAPGSKGSTQ